MGAREALVRIRRIAEQMRRTSLGSTPAAEPEEMAARHNADLVVVIERDDDARSVIGEVLNFHGYAALLMTTVEEALACVASIRVPPEAIVLDLDAPGRPGWQFLAERTRRVALRSIPVLAISGGDSDDEHRVIAADAEYVPKPLHFDEIVAGLQRAIARKPGSLPAGRLQLERNG